MKQTFKTTATLNERGKFYQHFGISPFTAMLYGDKPKDIVDVEFKISDNQSFENFDSNDFTVDYWGWYDNKDQKFGNMIFAKRFMLDMCFPAGIIATEESGKGKAYRLEITNVKKRHESKD